jgi:integrase
LTNFLELLHHQVANHRKASLSASMVIRMKGIKRVRAKGRVYYYHRKTGTRIRAEYGSRAFLDEVAALERKVEEQSGSQAPGTLGDMIEQYRASPEFRDLAERTRKDYQSVLDYLKALRGDPIGDFDTPRIWEIRDAAYAAKKRRFANYVVQVLSRLFSWMNARGKANGNINPAALVEHIRRPKDARVVNRRWTDPEIANVMAAASSEMRLAVALGLYTGLREGQVIRVTWSSYDGQRFEVRDQKTGAQLWIPAHRELRTLLDAAQRRSPVIVVGTRGRPFAGENGFRAMFFKLVRQLRAEGKVSDGLTFHGLRHTVGTKLAEAGCDTRDIMAITGHKTEAMAAHYTKGADQRRRATSAILKLERSGTRKRKTERTGVEN